jgi:hypothetical protein
MNNCKFVIKRSIHKKSHSKKEINNDTSSSHYIMGHVSSFKIIEIARILKKL